jgi:hypothetical protein
MNFLRANPDDPDDSRISSNGVNAAVLKPPSFQADVFPHEKTFFTWRNVLM